MGTHTTSWALASELRVGATCAEAAVEVTAGVTTQRDEDDEEHAQLKEDEDADDEHDGDEETDTEEEGGSVLGTASGLNGQAMWKVSMSPRRSNTERMVSVRDEEEDSTRARMR